MEKRKPVPEEITHPNLMEVSRENNKIRETLKKISEFYQLVSNFHQQLDNKEKKLFPDLPSIIDEGRQYIKAIQEQGLNWTQEPAFSSIAKNSATYRLEGEGKQGTNVITPAYSSVGETPRGRSKAKDPAGYRQRMWTTLAHIFNNQLSVVLGKLEIAMMEIKKKPESYPENLCDEITQLIKNVPRIKL